MNNAYKSENPMPHVHFHLRPRYKHPVKINGQTFIDNEFARHYSNGNGSGMDEATFNILYDMVAAPLATP